MFDILEMAFADDPEGWVHVHRLRTCNEPGVEIPKDTLEFFAAFCNAMLEAKHIARYSNRKDFNTAIKEVTLRELRVLKPTRGDSSLRDKSRSELLRTKAWGHAKAVSKKLDDEPILRQAEAITIVAGERDKEETTIRKAWEELGETVDGMFNFHARELLRLEAVKKDHAKKLVRYLRKRNRKKATVKVYFAKSKTSIKIDLNFTATVFSEHDGLPEILSRIASCDGEQHDPSTWNSVGSDNLCIISKKILAHIEKNI